MTFVPVVAPRPHPAVVEATVGESRVLFHLVDRRLHVLNGSAAAIWDELPTATTVGELTVGLGDRFSVDPRGIRADVERTLGRLRADGLVIVHDHVHAVSSPPPAPSGLLGAVDAPASGSFAALDARVGLHADDPEILAVMTEVLAPLASGDAATVGLRIRQESDRAWSVAVGDGAPVSVGSRLAVVLRALGEINNVAVASCPHDLVVHAGAVGGGDGVVLLPGGSNHGKSTLTTALVRSGLGYLTDEAAVVTARLDIRAFPKSIALDPGSFPLFPDLGPGEESGGLARALRSREWHVDPSGIGRVALLGPLRVVVCPTWRPGAATRLHRSAPTEALHELIGEAFDFRAGGQRVFDRLAALVERVPVYRLGYGDLDEAVAVVSALRADPEAPSLPV